MAFTLTQPNVHHPRTQQFVLPIEATRWILVIGIDWGQRFACFRARNESRSGHHMAAWAFRVFRVSIPAVVGGVPRDRPIVDRGRYRIVNKYR